MLDVRALFCYLLIMDAGDYYDDKAAEAQKLRDQIAQVEAIDPLCERESTRKQLWVLRQKLDQVLYVGD